MEIVVLVPMLLLLGLTVYYLARPGKPGPGPRRPPDDPPGAA